MGGSNSRPDIAGHRVLRVENSSPASAATQHWVPYLDVLVAAGGVDLTRDSSLLSAQLKAHIGLPLELTVMNAKSLEQRSVEVRGEFPPALSACTRALRVAHKRALATRLFVYLTLTMRMMHWHFPLLTLPTHFFPPHTPQPSR